MLTASEAVEYYQRSDVPEDAAFLQQAIHVRDAARRGLQLRSRVDQGDCPWVLGTMLDDYLEHSSRALAPATGLASARADMLYHGGPAVERAAAAVADI